jgi:hypothetical protein
MDQTKSASTTEITHKQDISATRDVSRSDIGPRSTNGNGKDDGDDDDDDCASRSTDDDYDLSDCDNGSNLESHNGWFVTNLSDHSNYLHNVLADALDLTGLDRSLALQARLSGKLNNETQKIVDKKDVLSEKLTNLQNLYRTNFLSDSGPSKVDRLKQDIVQLEQRIHVLKHGPKSSVFSILKSKNPGSESVVDRFPIEYNQARDKVIERQLDDQV